MEVEKMYKLLEFTKIVQDDRTSEVRNVSTKRREARC